MTCRPIVGLVRTITASLAEHHHQCEWYRPISCKLLVLTGGCLESQNTPGVSVEVSWLCALRTRGHPALVRCAVCHAPSRRSRVRPLCAAHARRPALPPVGRGVRRTVGCSRDSACSWAQGRRVWRCEGRASLVLPQLARMSSAAIADLHRSLPAACRLNPHKKRPTTSQLLLNPALLCLG